MAPLPLPFLHPHTSAPIDLERLEMINLSTSHPRNRGRTTAFVVHMVGCALVAQPCQMWVYVAQNHRAACYAKNMFVDILNTEPGSVVGSDCTSRRVTIHTGDSHNPAVFDFISLDHLENYVRGAIIQDYFLDISDQAMLDYNDKIPGVISALHTRIEIAPC